MPIDPENVERFKVASGTPKTMVIGDSLFNGVRSLTINAELASLAAPVMVAEALGEFMQAPDYPRPILFDLEAMLRQDLSLDVLRQTVVANGKAWLETAPKWSEHVFFDNIAVAGAEIESLWQDRAGDYRAQVPFLLQQIEHSGGVPGEAIGRLWYALNTGFLLNPSGEPDLNDCTALELVAFRRPERLLVSIGSNEGLFRAGLLARYTESVRAELKAIPGKMEDLATRMADAFGDGCVDHVYFTNLIKPSTIANLMPRVDPQGVPGCGNYFRAYFSRLLGGVDGISDGQMRQLDDLMRAVNEETEERVTRKLAVGGRAVHFVDIYDMSIGLDAKHGCVPPGQEIRVERRRVTWTLSNVPITTSLIFGFVRGGLFSLDNMHPTTVGYAVVANAILERIAATEGLSPRRVPLQAAFDADSLLQNLPRRYSLVSAVVNLIGTILLGRRRSAMV
ncbi:MAG: hypothetical protein EA405_09300 [Rhodospirillales bacterium]|nr:MAG: hypothetical protein EA405_09300 [Rhodospirillales bacterium]